MDLQTLLAPDVLLPLRTSELASHFKSIIDAVSTQQQHSVTDAHNHLIAQVQNGAIPPVTFNVWLPLVLRHDPSLLRSVLLDEGSQGIRNAGIKALKRALKGKQWKEDGWNAIGGVKGLKEIFEVFGVWESRELARAIGASNRTKNSEKTVVIDEIIQLMMPNLLPTPDSDSGSDSQTQDQQTHQRHLLPELILLAQGCSSDFLYKCLSNPRFPSNLAERVVYKLGYHHRDLMRRIAIGSAVVDSEVRTRILRSSLSDLIAWTVPWKPKHLLPAVSPNISPGIRFCLDLFYEIQTGPSLYYCIPNSVLIGHIITTMRLAIRRKIPFRDILVLLELGISAADTKSSGSISIGDTLLDALVHYWALAAYPSADPHMGESIPPSAHERQLSHPSTPKPEHRNSLEALLVRVIKAVPKHETKPKTLSLTLYRQLLRSLKPEFPASAKLPLIKLFCRHLPNICIDLDSEVLSENERLHLMWNIEMLEDLPCNDAKWLFKRAINIRPVQQVIKAYTSPWAALLNDDKAVYVPQILEVKWQAESGPIEAHVIPLARKCTCLTTFLILPSYMLM
jgi:hypothetical protein